MCDHKPKCVPKPWKFDKEAAEPKPRKRKLIDCEAEEEGNSKQKLKKIKMVQKEVDNIEQNVKKIRKILNGNGENENEVLTE